MNIKKFFSPDPGAINLNTLKSQSWIILILVIFSFSLFISACLKQYYFGNKTVSIEVYNKSNIKTYKDFTVDNSTYVTGIEGTLYYKTASFAEMLLFRKIGGQSIVDYFFFVVIGLILFFSIRKITDKKTFSEKIIKTFVSIGLLLLIFPRFNSYFESLAVEKLLLQKTNNMFELANIPFLQTNYFVAVSIILMFLYFLKKGSQLQEEQDLTV